MASCGGASEDVGSGRYGGPSTPPQAPGSASFMQRYASATRRKVLSYVTYVGFKVPSQDLFSQLDKDGSGVISREEFEQAARRARRMQP